MRCEFYPVEISCRVPARYRWKFPDGEIKRLCGTHKNFVKKGGVMIKIVKDGG